jgi:signal transduction histidine kinase
LIFGTVLSTIKLLFYREPADSDEPLREHGATAVDDDQSGASGHGPRLARSPGGPTRHLRLRGDVERATPQYRPDVSHRSSPEEWSHAEQLRALVPPFALAVAILAAVSDWSSAADLTLAAVAVGAFAVWAYVPNVPLAALSLAVVVPVVVAQRTGQLEPLLFEVSLLAFVVGRCAPSFAAALALGLLAVASPVVASLIQDPPEVAVGIWIMGIAFPWVIGCAAARQSQLATQLDATRRELAEQALLAERRRIARDVHDFVGHGLAAVMLQVTSARHVLRRDPAAAEEALTSAEEVGRRSMHELRRTVALLRSDDDTAVAPPLPSVRDIAALVDDARAGGLDVKLQTRGDLSRIAPSVGVALYRIAQEALANAARHAPEARTSLAIEAANGRARLVADTTGPTVAGQVGDPERPRFGIVGMRERATALGGEFAAGPTPEGWRVSCRLPLDERNAMRAGGSQSA